MYIFYIAAAAIGWSAINYPDLTVRAVAVAMVLMVGNVGSIVAAYLFRSTDAPRYGTYIFITTRFLAIVLICLFFSQFCIVFAVVFNLVTAIVSALISTLTGYLLYRENCRRDKYPDDNVRNFAGHFD